MALFDKKTKLRTRELDQRMESEMSGMKELKIVEVGRWFYVGIVMFHFA